jgi:hypothetical protein
MPPPFLRDGGNTVRKKKYIQVTDMGAMGIDVIDELNKSINSEEPLIYNWYTVTTSGGNNILWEVNEKDSSFYTVSTKAIKWKRVNPYVKVPVYEHYVLTEKGLSFCKERIMMESL